ncbi:MAG: CHC2 zinc finger domain-containing protein [bacterium]
MIDAKALKRQINIMDIIQRYSTSKITRVKPNEYKIKCPLPHHQENTPSFHFNTSKGLYHCFGCGSDGDVFDFISEMEGIDFTESVERLAENADVDISYTTGDSIDTSQLMKLVEELKDLKNEEIFSEDTVNEYCKNQHRYLLDLGFKPETLEYFDIGFCCDQNDDLYNRVTIPWRNHEGNLVAIVGRDITDTHKAKYKAKRGSSKQRYLYNLDKAKRHSGKGITVVEDEKSVLRLHEFGFKNVVAMGNCDLGERKWLLRRFTDTVFLCFDNDDCGKRETKKIVKELKILMNVYTIPLPNHKKDVAEIKDKELWLECWKRKERCK